MPSKKVPSKKTPASNARREKKELREQRDTRQIILSSAAMLFHEHGYDGTSITMLAKKVGVRPASIYYHFASKSEILYAFLTETGARLIETCRAAVESESGGAESKLRAFIKAHSLAEIDMLELMPLVDTNVFRATNLSNALTKKQRNQLVKGQREIVDILRTILLDGKAGGELQFDDITVTIYAVLGPIEHLVYWYRREGELAPEAVAEKLSDLLVRAVSP